MEERNAGDGGLQEPSPRSEKALAYTSSGVCLQARTCGYNIGKRMRVSCNSRVCMSCHLVSEKNWEFPSPLQGSWASRQIDRQLGAVVRDMRGMVEAMFGVYGETEGRRDGGRKRLYLRVTMVSAMTPVHSRSPVTRHLKF